jgi:hypothetical protein
VRNTFLCKFPSEAPSVQCGRSDVRNSGQVQMVFLSADQIWRMKIDLFSHGTGMLQVMTEVLLVCGNTTF